MDLRRPRGTCLGTASTGRPQAIVSAVKRLRRRLEGVEGVGIETVRGVGYRLVLADRAERG
ncbi:winged helix-turn-helix domain-containing protein [Myceligenerans pegani]|uniref:Winged helix-turn-helix domain-containing protein n=1 Tax=Myceligenerans pegani TaxID=2776917 RepID=A0ABR9MZC1_9MICO|nr:winged helix-turn-helix domain-containing protein [Myceligenerans sp. TRM 65318]MBE3018607.1 winged helix-turn-helix domain-containing protein [Myceligenerans sp. TRM 65318]